MKRLLAFILIFTLALPLVSCKKAAEDNAAQATFDPASQAFNPETDYDNRYGALYICAMLETEDAYYIYNRSYLMYYDKVLEESGYLCPKPECLHGEKNQNTACNAYITMPFNSLVYRDGQLWWVGDTNNSRNFAIFRMDLDGTNKEKVHEFEYSGEGRGMVRFYLHRDHLFYARTDQVIRNGNAFNTATFGCFDLDDYEKHILAVRESYFNPQPGMYFFGDSAYMFVSYDGINEETEDIPSLDYEYEAWLEWREQVKMKDEILRWDPSMDEPETIYLNSEDGVDWGYYSYYVHTDGTVWFTDKEYVGTDEDGEYVRNYYTSRVGADGKRERVLEWIDGDGRQYYPMVMSSGVVLGVNQEWVPKVGFDINSIWLRKLNGETVYKGELPMAFREKYTNIAPHTHGGLNCCWATENELLVRFDERYSGIGAHGSDMAYYDFVKYDITPDGLVETLLHHERMHFASDDDNIPDFG